MAYKDELEGGAAFISFKGCHVEEEDLLSSLIAPGEAETGSYWDAQPNKQLDNNSNRIPGCIYSSKKILGIQL